MVLLRGLARTNIDVPPANRSKEVGTQISNPMLFPVLASEDRIEKAEVKQTALFCVIMLAVKVLFSLSTISTHSEFALVEPSLISR